MRSLVCAATPALAQDGASSRQCYAVYPSATRLVIAIQLAVALIEREQPIRDLSRRLIKDYLQAVNAAAHPHAAGPGLAGE